ncbi:MAG: TldD/PmbA family protein [Rubrivivax sp.]|nr:TldD/PmbA family protein [Rubrivivax sp.]
MSPSLTYLESEHFEALAAALLQPDPALDRCTLHLCAETSDFLRFNQGALRQATGVQQTYVTVAVERGQRRTESLLSLCGDLAADVQRLQAERTLLTAQLDLIDDDPGLQRPAIATHSRRDERGALATAAHVIALVHEAAARGPKQDLVGFYAAGPVAHAFADSLGSRHWHRVESFHFDWCLYQRADKAVKTVYAGTHWDDAGFAARLDEATSRVQLLERPARTLQPGAYRVAFAPAAMAELLGMLGWGGFSLKARRTGVSSLMRLQRGDAAFAPGFHLDETIARSTTPAFSPEGFARPAEVALVKDGRPPATGGTLSSPRSAVEYGMPTTGAHGGESPEALHLHGGNIPDADLLHVLGTGLYISNLWYLNYSDRAACRMTGMTRYACFWVENGELVAPLNVMRFDDDVLRLFGPGLVGLTATPEFIPNSDTYGARGLGSVTTPAAVVEGLTLTL